MARGNNVDDEFDRSKGRNDAGQNVEEFEAPEIGPEEMAEHNANLMANALSSTKMFGIVEVKAGIGQVHVLGRVPREKERLFVDKVVFPVLSTIDRMDDCNGFVGKQFILKDGSVKYAWVISVASNDLKRAVSEVCRAFESAIPRMEVVEAPLLGPGTPQSGGQGTGRRGASPIR